jgi:hypothetical protein
LGPPSSTLSPQAALDLTRRREELRRVCAEAARLRRTMAGLRAQATSRRDELRRARADVRDDLLSRRSSLQTETARAAAAMLDAAAKVSGMERDDLWLQYFALGGDASPEELEGMLSGERPLYRLDHDRLVVALNERFQDHGRGRPLAFWDGSH